MRLIEIFLQSGYFEYDSFIEDSAHLDSMVIDLVGIDSLQLDLAGFDSAAIDSTGLGFEIHHKNSAADANTFQNFMHRFYAHIV